VASECQLGKKNEENPVKSYSELNVFEQSETIDYEQAVRFIQSVQGHYRCHELAHAVGEVLGLPVQDGYYEGINHSWLWTRPLPKLPAPSLPNILDVYVPGELPQVQLIHYASILPAWESYQWQVSVRFEVDRKLVMELADFFEDVLFQRES
jgi:hypothetical protein